MPTLQLMMLVLFAVFALLTAFFQVRISMKSGQAAQDQSSNAAQDGERYGRYARMCAICAGGFLLICILLGAFFR